MNLISKRLWEEDGQLELGSYFYKEWISLKAKNLSYQYWIVAKKLLILKNCHPNPSLSKEELQKILL